MNGMISMKFPASRRLPRRMEEPTIAVVYAFVLLWMAMSDWSIGQAAEPEIWLAPVDPIKRSGWADAGASDFLDLFPADAPWKTAKGYTQVFEIYPQFLYRSSDEMLRTVIEGLKSRHIALAVSYGLMHRPKGGPMHEGYGAELATRDIARLQRLGAEVRYVVADEPLLFGHFYWGEGATPLSIEDAAKDVASTARQFREAFPNVRIGMDDPVMLYRPDEWEPAMREFLDVYQKEFHEPMAFVRLECASFHVREWLPRYIAAEKVLRSVGVAFGELVTGDAADLADAKFDERSFEAMRSAGYGDVRDPGFDHAADLADLDWTLKAEERYVTWESDGRAAPAQVVFQSWMETPTHILPESAPRTLTHLLNGYFRERTILMVTQRAGVLRGRLIDASGNPLAGSHVALSVLLGFDADGMIHRVFAGSVPAEARFAQVGLRIGLEGSRAGAAHLTLGATEYEEKGPEGRSAVFGFEDGVKGWGVHGSAAATAASGPSRQPALLQISAESGQTLLVNSRLAPVTSGRDYQFTFDVRMQPDTETGYLVVFFFDAAKKVIKRDQVPLVDDNAHFVRDLVTDADGRIVVPLWADWLEWLRFSRAYRFAYPGDDLHRPAFATVPGVAH